MNESTIKPTLTRKIGITILLTFLVGLKAASAANIETSPADGMDDAKVGTVVVQRDPFWPVGYTPKWIIEKKPQVQGQVVEKEKSIDWNKAMEQVAIQGVSSRAGNEFFTVINGQVKSTGETVSVQLGDVNYTWMIENISPPSSVKLRRMTTQ
jgi:hypothetical protein